MINDALVHCSKIWQLSNRRPLEQSKFTQNDVSLWYSSLFLSDVVVKICPVLDITHEQQALSYFNGQGCVKLLAYDYEHKALLLDYIQPGVKLKTMFPDRENQSIEILIDVVKKLHANVAPIPAQAQTVDHWLQDLRHYSGDKVSAALRSQAVEVSDRLLHTQGTPYLLHGDLHHENILQYGTAWTAIDPMGVVGELAYECGAFIRNPVPELLDQQEAKALVAARIAVLTDAFQIDRQRLKDWVFVQAVLAACWSEWDYYSNFAQMVKSIE